MELRLENIRCHDLPITVTLPEKGLVLLEGKNGSGKSSIMDAIYFILYGSGKKIVTFGAKKCKAVLTYDGWKITRSKGPNRLLLIDEHEDEYEDDAAQELINTKFGTDFTIVSYIVQEGKDAFFNLGPSERMIFLEKLALKDVNVTDLKKKCKAKIKERKERLNEKVGELKVYSEQCSDLKMPQKVEFPLSGSKKNWELKKKNEGIKWKNNTKKLVKARKDLINTKDEQSTHVIQSQKKDHIMAQIVASEEKIAILEDQIADLPTCDDIDDIESRISFLLITKDLTQLRLSYASDVQQIDASCVIEMSQLKDDYDELIAFDVIKDELASIKVKIEEKEQQIKIRNKKKKCQEEITELDTEENYNEEIIRLRDLEQKLMESKVKIKDSLVVHKCPSCKVFLRMKSNNLELADNYTPVDGINEKEIDKQLRSIRSDKEEFESNVRDLKKLSTLLAQYTAEEETFLPNIDLTVDYSKIYNSHRDALQEQKARQKRIESIGQKIKNEEYSAAIQALKYRAEGKLASIKRAENNIKNYQTECNLDNKDDSDKLQKTLNSMRLIEQKREMLTDTVIQEKKALSSLKTKREAIPTTVDKLKEIAQLEESIDDYEQEEKSFKQRAEKIKLYEDYLRDQQVYNDKINKLNDAKESEKNARTSLAVADTFLRKIQETESAAVINIIDVINNHLRFYLEKFFTDPIIVEISSFKELASGDTKPSVNIKVGYKGNECEVNDISGGERAKVKLAICLAINAIAGGKIILLDEVMAHVDLDTVETITDILREDANDSGKLIISVLHGASHGQFDYIFDVEAINKE